jgi:hypothetical protein
MELLFNSGRKLLAISKHQKIRAKNKSECIHSLEALRSRFKNQRGNMYNVEKNLDRKATFPTINTNTLRGNIQINESLNAVVCRSNAGFVAA